MELFTQLFFFWYYVGDAYVSGRLATLLYRSDQSLNVSDSQKVHVNGVRTRRNNKWTVFFRRFEIHDRTQPLQIIEQSFTFPTS